MLKTLRQAPFPITLLIASFLFPSELSLHVADLRLPAHRVAILLILPFAVWRLTARGDVRWRIFDIALLGYASWALLAFTLHGRAAGGFVYGGSIALESFGAYVIARAYVRDFDTLQRTLEVLMIAVVTALLLALPEMLLGQHFTHDLLQRLTGHYHLRVIEQRFGLTRAMGTFDHPIHLGTFAATTVALVWFNGKRVRRRLQAIAVIIATTACALSSAPMLSAALQAGLLGWERVTRGLKGRVLILVAMLSSALMVVSLVSTRSIPMLIATGATIDPWTGYYRMQIWNWGLKTVERHPWFGIGLADWERAWWMHSASVDSYWLLVAMQTGLPSLLLLIAAVVLIVSFASIRARRWDTPEADGALRGWVIALAALCLVAVTVHYWNVTHSYFFFVLGLGGWLADPVPKRARSRHHPVAGSAVPTAPAGRGLAIAGDGHFRL
ncbi:MAG: O-antigen ligase family protein [Hyphomicrobiaceae bacterium]